MSGVNEGLQLLETGRHVNLEEIATLIRRRGRMLMRYRGLMNLASLTKQRLLAKMPFTNQVFEIPMSRIPLGDLVDTKGILFSFDEERRRTFEEGEESSLSEFNAHGLFLSIHREWFHIKLTLTVGRSFGWPEGSISGIEIEQATHYLSKVLTETAEFTFQTPEKLGHRVLFNLTRELRSVRDKGAEKQKELERELRRSGLVDQIVEIRLQNP